MKIILRTLLILITLFATRVDAASFQIMVDSGRENINALEGEVIIPPNLKVDRIETGRSAILIWVQSPTMGENGDITFAGIAPGGFQGKKAIFTISGEFEENDVSFANILALKSDGSGSPVSVAMSLQRVDLLVDNDPPEAFKPVIGSSPDAYDGRPFVSFLVQDKGVGIEGYESYSSWLLPPGEEDWTTATSPLELRKSDLFKIIYIRATDKSGNMKVGKVYGSYYYATLLSGTIIVLCVLYFVRRLFSRSS